MFVMGPHTGHLFTNCLPCLSLFFSHIPGFVCVSFLDFIPWLPVVSITAWLLTLHSHVTLNTLRATFSPFLFIQFTCNSILNHSVEITFTWAQHSHNWPKWWTYSCEHDCGFYVCEGEMKGRCFKCMCHRVINNSSVNTCRLMRPFSRHQAG